mmetsp:Transcript_38789/g.97739  ORF Transcript_38789/g.97739 Transcript_38789/m.97739 type:complete len:245 (-) Transcript_38789:129-863(-)
MTRQNLTTKVNCVVFGHGQGERIEQLESCTHGFIPEALYAGVLDAVAVGRTEDAIEDRSDHSSKGSRHRTTMDQCELAPAQSGDLLDGASTHFDEAHGSEGERTLSLCRTLDDQPRIQQGQSYAAQVAQVDAVLVQEEHQFAGGRRLDGQVLRAVRMLCVAENAGVTAQQTGSHRWHQSLAQEAARLTKRLQVAFSVHRVGGVATGTERRAQCRQEVGTQLECRATSTGQRPNLSDLADLSPRL